MRQSTKLKTKGVDARVAKSEAASAKYKARIHPPVKHQFTQKELLYDALDTEVSCFETHIVVEITRVLFKDINVSLTS